LEENKYIEEDRQMLTCLIVPLIILDLMETRYIKELITLEKNIS
jgi:hypothetical protein